MNRPAGEAVTPADIAEPGAGDESTPVAQAVPNVALSSSGANGFG
ncbi:MAG: hypothetical protein QM770_11255 [Tepidisphaeraceae bacterium]